METNTINAVTPRVRVLIVDDQDIIRVGLSLVIEEFDDIQLIGSAANGMEALQLCKTLKPDVVLLDLLMPGMDGITTISNIRTVYPKARIVVLTSSDDERLIQRALHAGALSYLVKNVTVPALIDAIRAATQGKSTLAQEATQVLIGVIQGPPAVGHDLSQRELETLKWMIRGLKNHEIAKQMMVSTSTVKKHVSSILNKLGVSNRLEAVTLALQQHILDN
jgi:DNA-binding NarL/FixJ family response regulator